jgi:predicted Fe-Mo cluster-binding NifX family protein
MKLCITSSGVSLDDSMDPRFGRCRYFIIWDADNEQFEAVENPAVSAGGGAGIQAAQLIANKGVETVLTGNVGPNAYNTLTAAGIKIVVGLTGITVRQAIEGFKTGKQEYTAGPSVGAHYGTGGGGSAPGGMGMGGGRGMGRGMGGGRGMDRGMQTGAAPQPPSSMDEDLKALKEQSQKMKQNLETIQERIDALNKKKG